MTSAALVAEGVELRAGAGEAPTLDQAERDRMLVALRSGSPDAPLRLRMTAVTFTDGPNDKHVRLKPAAMRAFAETSANTPFMRDHDQWSQEARGGTILSTKIVQRGGRSAFLQDIELQKPWAIEGALDGTIDRFSVAWGQRMGGSAPTCSICNKAMWGLSYDERCSHWPGRSYALEGQTEKVVCEIVYSDVVARETSAVPIPAVPNTEVESVREALSAARLNPTKEGVPMLEKIRVALGFAASDEAIDETRLAAEATKLRGKYDAEHEELSATKKALSKAEGELSELREVGLASKVDSLVERALAEGRILPGRGPKGEKLDANKRAIPGAGEKAIRSLAAAAGIEAAEEWVEALEARVPTASDIEAPRGKKAGVGSTKTLTTIQRAVNAQLGISDEDFKKFGPKPGQSLRSVEVEDDDDEPSKDAAPAAGKE